MAIVRVSQLPIEVVFKPANVKQVSQLAIEVVYTTEDVQWTPEQQPTTQVVIVS